MEHFGLTADGDVFAGGHGDGAGEPAGDAGDEHGVGGDGDAGDAGDEEEVGDDAVVESEEGGAEGGGAAGAEAGVSLGDGSVGADLGGEFGECGAVFALFLGEVAGVWVGDVFLDVDEFFASELGDDEAESEESGLEGEESDAEGGSMDDIAWFIVEEAGPVVGVSALGLGHLAEDFGGLVDAHGGELVVEPGGVEFVGDHFAESQAAIVGEGEVMLWRFGGGHGVSVSRDTGSARGERGMRDDRGTETRRRSGTGD